MRVENIDHLGIVAGIIDDMGLVETINRIVPQGPRQELSTGIVFKAMLLNALGFISAPLYQFSHFFEHRARSLLGVEVDAEKLNDDRLGRALDDLYAVGLSHIFLRAALLAVKGYNIETQQVHLDSTSISVSGDYCRDRLKIVEPAPA